MKLLFFEALRWLTLKRKSSLGEVLPQGVSSARNWQKEITFLTDYPSYRYIHYTTKQRKCLLNLIFGQFQDPHIFHVRSAWYLLQSTLIFQHFTKWIFNFYDICLVSSGVHFSVTNAASRTDIHLKLRSSLSLGDNQPTSVQGFFSNVKDNRCNYETFPPFPGRPACEEWRRSGNVQGSHFADGNLFTFKIESVSRNNRILNIF